MNEPTPPHHITRYVEELVECGVHLAAILDHMYRHDPHDPDIPSPPEVLRDLVASTLAPELRGERDEVKSATALLLQTSRAIEREIFLVHPEDAPISDECEPWIDDDLPLDGDPSLN